MKLKAVGIELLYASEKVFLDTLLTCELAARRIGEWVFLSIHSGEVHYNSLRMLNTLREPIQGTTARGNGLSRLINKQRLRLH